ncbi:OmpA family protein [candidate division WOR-3 bacterium]|nr:OmpA family protein [candidate division WOR-3 bacterium]
MKKLFLVLCVVPFLVSAQEIGLYGGRGMFKIQYARPHDMGVLSFHIGALERYQEIESYQGGRTVTDRRHFFDLTTGLSYSVIDYIDMRANINPFMKWFEMANYPLDRGDPDPVIGFGSILLGMKVGYPFIVEEMTPLYYAVGVDGYVDFGPGLSEEWFNNALEQDRRFYADSFPEAYPAGGIPYAPNFPPYIPHEADICVTGLFDFRIGPFAAHLNGGYLVTGLDERPLYVPVSDFIERPNYVPHGLGVELIPSKDFVILFETYGMFDMDAREESLWVTPGLRIGTQRVSFDMGCELGIVNPTSEDFWFKAFLNLSAGADLVKKVTIHIPIAKVTGRVYDANSGEPIQAAISFPGSDKEAIQTAPDGTYEVSFSPGSFRFHVEATNYLWKEKAVVLKDGDQVVLDFNLNTKPESKILGKIYDSETKEPLVAQITFPQTTIAPFSSGTDGMYDIIVDPGTYRIHVEATNYQFNEKVVTVNKDETKVVDIALAKIGVAQATLTGKISEVESGKPLQAQVKFVDTEYPAATTDPATGIYKITVKPGTYSVLVEAPDYVSESAPIVLAKDETKIQNFQLKPIPKVGEKIVLKGIYFDFNSAVIKPESYPVLDDAAKVLTAKPKMRVEIGGHTDSVGSDSYNQKLSYQRANAVRDYLIRYHNITPDRLIAVGYGETQPIADNRTTAGRDLNRRIEFKILSWE